MKHDALEHIPGVREIRAHRRELEQWHAEFDRQADSENGITSMPPCPADRREELRAMYPDAHAYLTALAYSSAANIAKSRAGGRALQRMADGVPPVEAAADMAREWQAYCDAHMWD